MRRRASLRIALVAVLATASGAALAEAPITPPPVPFDFQSPAGLRPFFVGHAVGTQNYVCLPAGASYGWSLFGPQATLFNDRGEQVATHYLSANPDEAGTPRATWQHSKDTSAVWAQAAAILTDAAYVEPGAIPWLLLRVVGDENGPGGGNKLSSATYLHRVNTSGGLVPDTGCSTPTDLGARAFVPYSADYYFYR